MKKDKEWLKNEVKSLFDEAYDSGKMEYHESEESIHRINSLVEQLDEPEEEERFYTFDNAKKWLQDNGFVVFEKDKLDEEVQRMIDETYEAMNEKPVIPQFVAKHIEASKKIGDRLNVALSKSPETGMVKKMNVTISEANNIYARAWLDGYEVEKEPVYFAKIKGHEFIQRIPIFDEDTGENISDYYRNVYFVLQGNGDLIVDMKDNGLSGAKNVMTLSQWNGLGINETNADFEEFTASHR